MATTENPILAGIMWLAMTLAESNWLDWGGSSEGFKATYGEWLTKDNWTTV